MPTEGFDMTDNRKFADFKVVNETGNIIAPILKIAKGCWTWLTNHQDVKARQWCPQMIMEEFFEDLDICFRTHFEDERQYNLIDKHDSWMEHLQAHSNAYSTPTSGNLCGKTLLRKSSALIWIENGNGLFSLKTLITALFYQ
jgi:hypothetical protein